MAKNDNTVDQADEHARALLSNKHGRRSPKVAPENWNARAESQRSTGDYAAGDPSTQVVGRRSASRKLGRGYQAEEKPNDLPNKWLGKTPRNPPALYHPGSRHEEASKRYGNGFGKASSTTTGRTTGGKD